MACFNVPSQYPLGETEETHSKPHTNGSVSRKRFEPEWKSETLPFVPICSICRDGIRLQRLRKPTQNLTQVGRCRQRDSNLNRSQKRCRLRQFIWFIGIIRTFLIVAEEAGTRQSQKDVPVGYWEARIVSLTMAAV